MSPQKAKPPAGKQQSAKAPSPTKPTSSAAAKQPAAREPVAEKPADAAKPGRAPVDKKTLAHLRKALEAERENLRLQAAAIEEERRRLAADRDALDDNFTDESGEGATTTMEQEKDISIAANVADLIEKVEAALVRMDAGTYGMCERCGQPIGKARLEALPWAALCISCKQKEEHRYF